MIYTEYPNDEMILDIIKNYISNSIYPYAIMIDGQWSSGKTFFVKNKLIKELSEYIKENSQKYDQIIYVSLYGISEINTIPTRIILNINEHHKLKKTIPFIKDIAKATGKAINIDLDDFFSAICEIINWERYIIIFDDLERCNCDITEVMGFINNLVEHHGSKAILVANEAEIENHNSHIDPLEYIVAKDEKIITAIDNKKKNEPKEPLTASLLKKRANEIFDRESNYERIKEKLIAHTIKYRPNLDIIIDAIINGNIKKDTNLHKIIVPEETKLIKILKDEDFYNLRTFQFFVEIINRLDGILTDIYGLDNNDVLTQVINYCLNVSVKYKKGNYKIPWKDDDLYGKVSLTNDPYFRDAIFGFAFVDYAIAYNIYDKHFIKKTIDTYRIEKLAEREIESQQNDPSILLLQDWYLYSEDEVFNEIINVRDKIKKLAYSLKQYPNIIYTVLPPIIECNFDKSIFGEITNMMYEHIKNNDVEFTYRDFRIVSSESTITAEYNKCVDIIREILMKKSKSTLFDSIDDALTQQNWAESLCDITDCYEYNSQNKSILGFLNMNSIVNLIKASNSKQIFNFLSFVHNVYHFENIEDFYRNDIENIHTLIKGLEEINVNDFDIIKQRNISNLNNLLKAKYQRLCM